MSLAKEATLSLKGLFEDSVQGDAAMIGIGRMLGINSDWVGGKLNLHKGEHRAISFNYDFINQPDLAQTIAVMCAAKGVQASLSGLKTLRIKETDRIDALNRELGKINSSFTLGSNKKKSGEIYQVGPKVSFKDGIPRFETYKDHRMAMAFAPLALVNPIQVVKPEVVSKSYPSFWEDLSSLGFMIEPVASE